MIERPKHLSVPPDDATIWRYTDLPKLLSLFSKMALWFARLDKLTDEFEGMLPDANQRIIYEDRKALNPGRPGVEAFLEMSKEIANIQQHKQWTLINSWSVGDHESFALWKIYLNNSPYGVAIQSTVKDFVEAFEDCEFKITPLEVRYYDHLKEALKDVNQETVSGSKNNFYFYEREFRAIIKHQFNLDRSSNTRVPKFEGGTYVPVDVSKLVKAVYVSPSSPNWFFDLVKDLLTKYDLDIIVRKSDIRDKL